MKLKFKQSVATAEITYNVGEVYNVENIEQAQSLIDAGYAEVPEDTKVTPIVETVQETKEVKPKRKNKEKAGE